MKTTIDAAYLWPKPWAEPPHAGGNVTLSGDKISAVADAPPKGEFLVIPGLVNAHDHGRGIAPLAAGAQDGPLEAWLWDLHRIPDVDPYLTALVAFGRMALSGVTTVVHNHLPRGDDLEKEAAAVARAAGDVGLRLAFVAPVMDQNLAGYDGGAAMQAELDHKDWQSIEAVQSRPSLNDQIAAVHATGRKINNSSVITQFGPPGPQWLSNKGWEMIAEAAAGGERVHVHLLETRLQRDWLDRNCPGGTADFFAQFGLLNDRLTIAHGVFLRASELLAFADAGTTLVLNISSNLRLGSGIASGVTLASSGIRLGLGMDGLSFDDDSDMLRELRLATMLLGPRRFDQLGLSRETLLGAAFATGKAAYDGMIGKGIEIGSDADLVCLSLDALAADRTDDSPEALAAMAFGRWRRLAVRDVWANGQCIVKDGRLTRISLSEVEAELTACARAAIKTPDWVARARAACIHAAKT